MKIRAVYIPDVRYNECNVFELNEATGWFEMINDPEFRYEKDVVYGDHSWIIFEVDFKNETAKMIERLKRDFGIYPFVSNFQDCYTDISKLSVERLKKEEPRQNSVYYLWDEYLVPEGYTDDETRFYGAYTNWKKDMQTLWEEEGNKNDFTANWVLKKYQEAQEDGLTFWAQEQDKEP